MDAKQLNRCFLRWIKAWNASRNQKLITIDAMGTQKEIAKQIIEGGA